MFIAGAIFFIGGVLITVTMGSSPNWFLFIPYRVTPSPNTVLGLTLTLVGISLLIYGMGIGFYYGHDRAWYMQELYKAHSLEVSTAGIKRRKRRNGIQTSAI
jgi:hypothetical protein